MPFTKNEITKFFHSLVGQRFNESTLIETLNDFFVTTIVLEEISRDADELPDFNYNGYIDVYGVFFYFDIYYLKMRVTGFDGSTFYITETAHDF